MAKRQMPDLEGNPIRILRKKENLTIQEAADRAEVNWQAWYLTESGCYADPLPAILDFFRQLYFHREEAFIGDKIREEYRAWVFNRRTMFVWDNDNLPNPDHRINPVLALIESIGYDATSFAKALCIQPAVLYKVSKAQQRRLPEQLRNALIESSFSYVNLEELQERYDEFYDFVHFET